MLNPLIFKKVFTTSTDHVAELLKTLKSFFGCVYLENHHSPVIACLPTQYWQSDEQTIKTYIRTDLQYEQHTNTTTDLSQNFQFSHAATQRDVAGFHGGYIGFIDYNYAANQNIHVKNLAQPQFYIGCYRSYIKREQQQWVFYSDEADAEQIYDLIQSRLTAEPHQPSFRLTTPCQALWSKSQYQSAFQRVHAYIRAGDCYQINLTQKFAATAVGDLLETAEQLWQLTDAPYAAYLNIEQFELLSCSPELFIEFGPNRTLITKPIKGTLPRYADPILDAQSKQQLIDSKKDQAENVMIVDLLRNDLSVYAEVGSVKTPKLFQIESFNQVHHMVSEVRATLKANVNPFDLLMSALPGGSITGAPKIRAMQIIEELEVAPRGAYCGTVGYFNFDGTGSWNILIRSIQKYQDQVSLWAGGGITIASDCDAEYQECFDKVSAMLNLLNTWQNSKP